MTIKTMGTIRVRVIMPDGENSYMAQKFLNKNMGWKVINVQ